MTKGHIGGTTAVLALVYALAGGLSDRVVASAARAGYQTSVSTADLRVLQREVDALHGDLERQPDDVRSEWQADLDDIDDEVAYLRVMLRRDGTVSQREFDELRQRVERLHDRMLDGERADNDRNETTISVGTEVDVRLQSSLSSDTAEVEDRFYATVIEDLRIDNQVVIPAGAEVRGIVSAVDRSSRTDRSASLTLAFDQLVAHGRTYPVRLTLTDSQESGIRDEATRIGLGAGVGGVIGGLLGGTRGALAGILIGGGGTVAATEGEDVELAAGTVLRARFDSAVTVEP